MFVVALDLRWLIWNAGNRFEPTLVENTLLLETDYNRSFLDREELVDVWRILKSGMLTKRKLGLRGFEGLPVA